MQVTTLMASDRKHPSHTNPDNRTNRDWVQRLKPPPDGKAIDELRDLLLRGLKPALSPYIDREQDAFLKDVTQDSLLKILEKLDTYRSDGPFLAWALKVAVRQGLSELRRKKWSDLSFDVILDEANQGQSAAGLITSAEISAGPDRAAHHRMAIELITEIIETELSSRQRTAITALMVHGISVTVVAEQMGITRNALYKLLHDARKTLKKRLEARGIDPDDLLGSM